MIAGETVAVLRPVPGGPDAMGEPSVSWERETVENVLASPRRASDLAAERPHGTKASVTLHFPKGYGKPLRGCVVEWRGERWRVVGDPRPYDEANTPGRWSLPAECEACHG